MSTQLSPDLVLETYSDALMENQNISYAAVVEQDRDYLVEVGVYDLAVQSTALKNAKDDKSGVNLYVPDQLEIPKRHHAYLDDEVDFVEVIIAETSAIKVQYKNKCRPAEGGDSVGKVHTTTSGRASITKSPNRRILKGTTLALSTQSVEAQIRAARDTGFLYF